MNTVNWIPHVLPGGDQEGEPQAGHHSQCVMESEDAGVYLDMWNLSQAFEASEDVQHVEFVEASLEKILEFHYNLFTLTLHSLTCHYLILVHIHCSQASVAICHSSLDTEDKVWVGTS